VTTKDVDAGFVYYEQTIIQRGHTWSGTGTTRQLILVEPWLAESVPNTERWKENIMGYHKNTFNRTMLSCQHTNTCICLGSVTFET